MDCDFVWFPVFQAILISSSSIWYPIVYCLAMNFCSFCIDLECAQPRNLVNHHNIWHDWKSSVKKDVNIEVIRHLA